MKSVYQRKTIKNKLVVNKLNISKQREKLDYDTSTKTLPQINADQYVRVQNGKIWTTTAITQTYK